jgi:alpha-tubulin suppressor-like RCC1 family protein
MTDDITIETLNKNNPDKVLTIRLNDYIVKNSVLIPENEFLSQELFYEGGEVHLEEYLIYLIDNLEHKSVIVLDVPYFVEKKDYRKKLEELVQRLFPEFIMRTAGKNNYVFLIRSEEVGSIIFSFSDDQIEEVLSLLFLKKMAECKLELDPIDESENFVFPINESIMYEDSTADSVAFSIGSNCWSLRQMIIDRNQLKYSETYRQATVSFIILVYDEQINSFRVDQETESNKINIRNLEANKGYYVKVAIKFGDLYSQNSKAFILFTKLKEEKTSYYVTGLNLNKCLMLTEQNYDKEEFKLRLRVSDKDLDEVTAKNFDDNFISNCVRLDNDNVNSVRINSENSTMLLNNGRVMTIADEVTSCSDSPIFEVDHNTRTLKREELYYIKMPKYVRKISCGDTFSLFLTIDNECYSNGFNKYGELGLNLPVYTYVSIPQRVKIEHEGSLVPVIDIATGSNHAITKIYHNERSFIYTWGRDQKLHYSFKTPSDKPKFPDTYERQDSSLPSIINFLEAQYVVALKASFRSSAFICYNPTKSINTVLTNGKLNTPSNLGYSISKLEDLNILPILVDTFTEKHSVLDVSFGPLHTLFLVKNMQTGINEVYACGKNENYIYGPDNNEVGSDIPVKIRCDFESEPIDIFAGISHSIVLTKDNDIVMFRKEDNCDIFRIFDELDLKDKKIQEFGTYNTNIYILTEK